MKKTWVVFFIILAFLTACRSVETVISASKKTHVTKAHLTTILVAAPQYDSILTSRVR